MNVLLPSRYDERITGLALGVECYDANTFREVPAPMRVTIESLVVNRRAGVAGDVALRVRPGVDHLRPRGRGRFALRYTDLLRPAHLPTTDDGLPGLTATLRVEPADRSRRAVARRVVVTTDPIDGLPTADVLRTSTRTLGIFPGPAAPLPARATLVRGHATIAPDGVEPARWVRAVATDALDNQVGFAHGDERGEFVMVIGSGGAPPAAEMAVTLFVSATGPGPVDPADPLADQQPETVPPPAVGEEPRDHPRSSGRLLHVTDARWTQVDLVLPTGRTTTVPITL